MRISKLFKINLAHAAVQVVPMLLALYVVHGFTPKEAILLVIVMAGAIGELAGTFVGKEFYAPEDEEEERDDDFE